MKANSYSPHECVAAEKPEETHVLKMTGPPGSGKTFNIQQQAAELSDEIPPSEHLIVTFTNSKAEGLERDFEPSNADHDLPEGYTAGVEIRTIGSICYKLARQHTDLEWDAVISATNPYDEEYFREFFEEQTRYTFRSRSTEKKRNLDTTNEPVGNKIIGALNYVRQLCQEPTKENLRNCRVDTGTNAAEAAEIIQKWQDWKRENHIIQHHDYLWETLAAGLVPAEFGLLMIDEAQDLSQLEFSLYNLWRNSGEFDRIVLVGDPAQSIYGFKAASGGNLQQTECDEHTELTQSYRCSQQVLDAATKYISGLEYDDDIDSVHDKSGSVQKTRLFRDEDLADEVEQSLDNTDNLMILARTNRKVRKIARILEGAGIPYTPLGHADSVQKNGLWHWTEMQNYYSVLNAMRTGAELPPQGFQVFLERLDTQDILGWENIYLDAARVGTLADEIENRGEYSVAEFDGRDAVKILDNPSFDSLLDRLSINRRQQKMLENAVLADHNHLPQNVRIGTIHSAKGDEAEHVFLHGDYNRSQLERYRSDKLTRQEEKRLYYTACTRAETNLTVFHNFSGTEEIPLLGEL